MAAPLSNRSSWANLGGGAMARYVARGKVRRSVAILAGPLSALALGGWDSRPLEADQVAQLAMIGLSKKAILACMGAPATRVGAGEGTEIWTYPNNWMRGYGPQWALGLNANLRPFTPFATCEVELVMTNARVSRIAYAAADGRPLPIGQECPFAVERCAEPP